MDWTIERGSIWLIDLGLAATPRPGLVMSVAFLDHERAVVTYVARSTQPRGTRFEVEHVAPQFVPGVFDAQNIGTVPSVKLVRPLCRLSASKFAEVESAVKHWLGFAPNAVDR